MRRTTCSGCGYDDLRPVLDLGLSPIADAYTATATEVSPRYPLQLAVCTGCKLVQLLDVIDHDTLFGSDYSFYSSASTPLRRYHELYAQDVMYSHRITRPVVEIGCNDGDLLQWFAKPGHVVLGVDPSGGPVAAAQKRGLEVLNEPFSSEVGARLADEYGPADVVIANHVLAHVESVSDTLYGISKLMDADSVAIIEVQYLPDLLLGNAFDMVYHEHRNFFSLTTLDAVVRRWNLRVVDAELTGRQGGSLRVTLRRAGQRDPDVEKLLASERWLGNLDVYAGLQGRADRLRDRLRDLLFDELAEKQVVVGCGAPAKATTLLNFCGLDSTWIDYIFDTTSAKFGRYVPGTGIPIVPQSETKLLPCNTVLLLAWNYASAILRDHHAEMAAGTRWALPIPWPVVL